jgi:hypothetical protein
MRARYFNVTRFYLMLIMTAIVSAGADQAFSQELPARNIDEAFTRISREVPAFAGLWKERDVLVIGLTDTSSRTTEQVMPVIRTVFRGRSVLPDAFRFVLVQHSFMTLKEARIRARDLLSDQTATLVDVDERNNCVVVGIADLSQAEAARARIIGLGINERLVRIEQIDPFKSLGDISSLQNRVRPIVGGIQIEHSTSSGVAGGTLGLVLKRNGLRGFITNSHVTNTPGGVEGTVMFQADSTQANDRIGVELVDPTYFNHSTNSDCPSGRVCRFSDSAFLSVDETVTAKRGVISSWSWPNGYYPPQEVIGTVPITICGENVLKIGRTTGRTGGEVFRTCVDLDDSKTSNTTLLCQDVFYGEAGAGDSGSPVYSSTSQADKVRFHGLAALASTNRVAFSPVSAIEEELGGSLDFLAGNDPPRVTIVEPQHGTTVTLGFGDTVTLRAEVFDPEGKACGAQFNTCTVTWSSNVDGVLGQGLEVQTSFSTVGPRIITATVEDGPNTVADSIALFVVSNPPTVTIHFPVNNATLYRYVQYMLNATADDPNTVGAVPCNQITWSSNNSADTGQQGDFPKTGCAVQVAFHTTGPRTLTASATGSQGNTGTANVNIQVADLPASGPPIISILFPVDGTKLYPDISQHLVAIIIDPDGGGPLTYRWKIKYGTTEKVIFNKMAPSSVQIADPWKPGDDVPNICGGVPAILTLEATDDEGQTTSVSVHIVIPYPVC